MVAFRIVCTRDATPGIELYSKATAILDGTINTVKIWLLVGSALTYISAAPANAQDQNAVNASDPGAIIVTARRVEEKLQDVPISISVYSQQQIADRNIVSTVDLATFTPSLAVNTRFGAEKAFFAIRGFTQEPNTAPSVGVYFADVISPRLANGTGGGNGAGPGTLMDLQNIQVLKGPQGTLQGRNTTGGAILIVPHRPTANFEGYIEGTFGNYGAERVQAVINVPLTSTIRTRLAIDSNQRDGYLRNVSGIGPSNFANTNYIAARFSAIIDLTPDLENYTIFSYSRSKTNGQLGVAAVCNHNAIGGALDGATSFVRIQQCAGLDARATSHLGYYDVTNSLPGAFEYQRQIQLINTTTWKPIDTLTIKNIFSYGRAVESGALNIEGDNTANPFAALIPGPHAPEASMDTVVEELQFQGRSANEKFIWQGGGYLEISNPVGPQEQYSAIFAGTCTNITAEQCSPPIPAASQVSIARQNYRFRNHALYAQATYKLTEQLSVTGGARYTWDRELSSADNITFTPSPTGPVFSAASPRCSIATNQTPADPTLRADLATNRLCLVNLAPVVSSKPTWLIDLDYKPTKDILVYGKYARGYRAGGVNSASYNPNPAASPPYWGPEKVDAYEVGLKTTWHGAVKGTFDVAAFYNFFTNQQLSINIPNCTLPANLAAGCLITHPNIGINGIFNAGTSHIKGIEADAALELAKGLEVDAGYTYLDAKVVGTTIPPCDPQNYNCGAATYPNVGDAIPLSPKNRVTITGTYTLPLDPRIGKISVGATFTHTDSSYFSHGDDHAFAIGAIPFNPSHLPATNLVNVNMNWKDVAGLPVDLGLFATNVTKVKYWVASTNAISSTGADFIQLGEPRMIGARVKVRFGK